MKKYALLINVQKRMMASLDRYSTQTYKRSNVREILSWLVSVFIFVGGSLGMFWEDFNYCQIKDEMFSCPLKVLYVMGCIVLGILMLTFLTCCMCRKCCVKKTYLPITWEDPDYRTFA